MAIESCKHLYIKSSDTRFLSGEVLLTENKEGDFHKGKYDI